MRLVLDELYSPEIARQLRARGHDVISAHERPDLIELSDSDLFVRMREEGRTIVTNDVGDFMHLVNEAAAAGELHAGLVLTSDRSMPRSRATIGRFVEVLESLLQAHPEERALENSCRWVP